MFNKGIFGTALVSEAADRLFSNITASNTPDQSFLATLRALLHNRLPQNETMHLTCKRLYLSEDEILSATTAQCMSWFVPDAMLYTDTSEHRVYIVHTLQASVGDKMLEIIKANAGTDKRHMENYTRRDDLQVFFARKTKALFYTDISGRNAIIFTNRLEPKHFHALQMMLPKYLPSLFTDSPLTEQEILLLKSCGNKSAVEYEELIEDFAKNFDIRAEIIRSKLAGFETAFERIRADAIREELSYYQTEYDNHLSTMLNLATKMQEHRYTLAGLECVINTQTGDSELMQYFMCNKNLTIIDVAGITVEFIVHGYADVYDIDAFEQYVSNLNGFMYSNLSSAITKGQMEKLYRAIFSEGTYKLRICAAYRADMRTGLKGIQQ